MKTAWNELTLQKCVDGELTEAERAALLNQIDKAGTVEGWKTLALSFVENQVLSKALQTELTPPVSPPPQVKSRRPFLKRQVQSWVSVAASLMVGAIVGVGGHFWMREAPAPGQQFTETPTTGETLGNPILASSEELSPSSDSATPHIAGTRYVPVMNVNMKSRGSSDGRGISVPVYSPDHLKPLPANGALTNISEEVQKILESEGYTLDREHHWYRVRMGDGREALVPGEYVRVRNPQTDSAEPGK